MVELLAQLASYLAIVMASGGVGVVPAPAPDEPHCADGQRTPPGPVCGMFEAAPKLPADHETAQAIVRVWRRVAPPVAALTGRDTAVSVLAPGARLENGERFPPSAYICPGAPPTIYVPYTLAEKVVGAGATYPEDFLAFVLAHELGHRINDFTPDGCQLSAFERPGQGVEEEQLADFRGAFFAAVAGFSTRRLADESIVDGFLAAEFRVREGERAKRREALVRALARFDAYESVYQAGVALLLAGDPESALRLLGWADELTAGQGVPLPELSIVHALALMESAAPHAPWLEAAGPARAAMAHLRCHGVFPAHSAFSDDPVPRRVRSDDGAQDRAQAQLRRAQRLLERARALGGDRLATESGLACVALYLDDHRDAARWQRRAEARLSLTTPRGVHDQLAANAALVDWQQLLSEAPIPAPGTPEVSAWAGVVASRRAGLSRHAPLDEVVAALLIDPSARRLRAAPPMLDCAGDRRPAPPMPPPPPTSSGERCPDGWAWVAQAPAASAAAKTGTQAGVVRCDGPDHARAYRVTLPEALDPPLASVDMSIVAYDTVPAGLASLDAWACGCDAVIPRGTSDRGERAFAVSCPAAGLDSGVVLASPDGDVTRVLRL